MHAYARTSELVHAEFSSDMHNSQSEFSRRHASSRVLPALAGEHLTAHAEHASPTEFLSAAPQAPVSLQGMEQVAKLVIEAEKDADNAWATSLGQLLDAMAASRMALLSWYILTGQDRRKQKGPSTNPPRA